MNNYDDLYNDLPEETTSDYIAKIENQLECVQKQYDDSQLFIKQLTEEKHNQKKRISELEKVVENLSRNMSSLYKTAVEEIKRNNKSINEIRSEYEDMSFRRKKCADCGRDIFRDHRNNCERHLRDDSPVEEVDEDFRRNREESTYDEFKLENDVSTFRVRHRLKNNCDRDRSRDLWNNCGRYKDGSPPDEKYKSKVRCKRLQNSKRRHVDERQRFDVRREKSDSSERNDRRNGEFHSKERYPKSLPKMVDGKERRSISPRNRIENSFDIKNRLEVRNDHRSSREIHHKSYIPSNIRNSPEAPTSSQYAVSDHRRSQENNLKSYIPSNIKNGSVAPTSSQYAVSDHRRSQEKHLKPQISSSIKNDPEAQTSSQHAKNEHRRNQEKPPKSQIISSIKNGPEVLTSSQHVEIERLSSQDQRPKSQIISSNIKSGRQMQTTSQNELRNSQEPKSEINSGIKNGPAVQTYLQNAQSEHRSSQEKPPKSQIISSAKNGPEMLTSSQYVENEHRSNLNKHPRSEIVSTNVKSRPEMPPSSQNELRGSQEKHPNSLIISSSIKNGPEAQTSSQYVKNEQQSQNKYSKPQIISSNTKNKSESKTTAPIDQKKSLKGPIEKSSSVETDPIRQNSSNLLKIEPRSQHPFRSLVKSSTPEENPATSIDTRTVNSSNIENNLKTVPDRSKKLKSNTAERLVALFGTDDIPTPHDILVNDKNENHVEEKEKEKPAQRNGYLRCEAALLSMKKNSCRLLTPIKDTPDLLKEKFSQIENNKINPVIPMINERRMLSPYKNVAIVEIVSQNDNESELSKPTESETVTTCSVTVSEDIEHGVFSRKSRKRPRIHKIVTNVKKVATC